MSKIHSYDEEKVFFYQIDRHAKSISSEQFNNIDSVTRYLSKPVPRDHEHRELFLARAIIVWLGQRLEEVLSGVYRYTPEAIVDDVESGELAHVFKILCEKAGVDCVIIEGYSKDSRYRPGDDGCSPGLWNAFVADGKWHFVHPVWCIMCLEGQNNDDEIQIEVDGRAVVTRDDEDVDQRTVQNFNEFWFCTNPRIFSLHCFPTDSTWQLQSDHYRIRNEEDFCSLPYLHSFFFENKLRLLSDYSCLLLAHDGKCKIVLQGEKNSAQYLDFSYTLSLLNSDDDAETLALEDMQLLVFYARNQETVSFEITFPLVGVYMFRLFIDDLESETLAFCCEFNIVCNEVDSTCKKLPIDAGSIGWGYGHQAEEAGILKPSVTNPKVNLNTLFNEHEGIGRNDERKIRFQLDKDLMDNIEYDAAVYADPSDVHVSVAGTTETTVDKAKGELEVRFSMQGECQYALVVKAKRKDEEETKAVLNFLLQNSESEDKTGDILIKHRVRELQNIEKREEKIEKKRKLENMALVIQGELLALKQNLRANGHDISDDEIDDDIDDDVAEINENLEVMEEDVFDNESELEVELTYTQNTRTGGHSEDIDNHKHGTQHTDTPRSLNEKPSKQQSNVKQTSMCKIL